MKRTYHLISRLLPLLFLFMAGDLYAQRKVTGTVVSQADQKPLANVNVVVKGATNGVRTNARGRYSIRVPDDKAVLIFSSVGFNRHVEKVGRRTDISIALIEKIKQLDEVVTIGYGSVRKSDLTGAVSSVKMKDLEGASMNSLEQGLQGRISGVQITQSSAAPDGGMSMIIRGANSLIGGTEPLYVINGVPISGGNVKISGPDDGTGPAGEGQELSQAPNLLSFLNPDDIESIEILKDASATAIYGSRASNGVVLITTKKGKQTATIGLSAVTEVVQPFRKWDLLNASEYAEYRNMNKIVNDYMNGKTYEQIMAEGLPYRGTYGADGTYIPAPEDFSNGNFGSTDWQDVIFRTAISQRYSLNLSGTANKLRYYLGGSYNDLQGPVVNSSFKRYSFNSTLNGEVVKKVNVSNSMMAVRTIGYRSQSDISASGNNQGIMTSAYRANPLTHIGQIWYNLDEGDLIGSDDPYVLATAFDDVRTTTLLMNNLALDWEIIKNLHFKTSGAVRYSMNQRDMYYPMSTRRGQLRGNGQAFQSNAELLYLINENLLTYGIKRRRHKLDILAGFTQEKTNTRSLNASTRNFLNDLTGYYELGAGAEFNKPGSGAGQVTLKSFFYRANYNYDGRYLLTATIRADGSSKFGENNKWGYFPSAGFAWNIGKESFMRAVSAVSNLKLRLSYGITGNQGLASYQSLPHLTTVNYPFNDEIAIGYQNNVIENPNLKWERTTQYNVGFDLGLFNGRISMTGDYYIKKTTDLLQVVSLSPSTGYISQVQNLGSLENKGAELELSAKVLTGKLKWDMGLVWFKNDIKVLDLGGMEEYPGAWVQSWDWRPFPIKVGSPLGEIYGYKVEKVMKTQEDVDNAANDLTTKRIGEFDYVKDKDGNMQRFNLGSTNPKFSFGFNSRFTYRNFELAFHFAGSIGQKIFNLQDRLLLYGDGSQTTREYLKRFWVPEIKDASGKVVIPDNGGDLHMIAAPWGRTSLSSITAPNDLMIHDGSWIKLRNLQLSWTLPKKYRPSWLKGLKLFGSITNLFSIDNYSGVDPEASVYGQDPTRRGVAFGEYPMSRTFTFRVDFQF